MQRCILDVDKETLKNAPGYNKNELPGWTDRTYAVRIYSRYGSTPWWSE